jgi:bacterial leucyl aminopeptidase
MLVFSKDISRLKRGYTALLLVFMTFPVFLFVSCNKDDDKVYTAKELFTIDLNDAISSDSLKSYVQWMESMGTRFALASNRRDIAIKIRNRFRTFGYNNAVLDSFMISKSYNGTLYQVWQFNVIATLEGSGSSDSVSILGGHYDNNLMSGDPFLIVPGANDNASGVAATFEIARVMKRNNYIPEGTIKFIAFAGEELGLFGSYNYAGKAKDNHEKIRIMLNNDMIAYQKLADRSAWVVNIIDYNNSVSLRKKAEELSTKFTVLKFKNENTYNRQSDSYPFFVNGYKPLFFFSDVIDPNYHSLNDLASNCNFEYCSEIVRLNCAMLVDLN